MITAEQIMAGKLPTSSREFDIPGVGKLKLHRLPAVDEAKAKEMFNDEQADFKKLEKLAQRNIYYMLHGEFNDKEAVKLPNLLDTNQLAMIYSTGLFFTDLKQDNLEAIEKKLKEQPELAALCNLADSLGCSIYELRQRLPAEELELRLVHHSNKIGLTFDRTKQREIEAEKNRRDTEAFLNTCPWRKLRKHK